MVSFANGEKYIIAYDPILDKKACKLSQTLELALGNGMAAIIVSGNMAIIETEQCFGTPMRYICYTKVSWRSQCCSENMKHWEF